MKEFETFIRTQIGQCHYNLGYNCQDYSFEYQDDEKIILIVTDGVGGIPYSECSAILESFSILSLLRNRSSLDLNNKHLINSLIEGRLFLIKENIKYGISNDFLNNQIYGNTLIICTLTKDTCNIYAKGDGYYAIDGRMQEVIKNRELVQDCIIDHRYEISTDYINNVLISTDGLRFFPKNTILSEKGINENFTLMDNVISDYKSELRDDLAIGIIKRKCSN